MISKFFALQYELPLQDDDRQNWVASTGKQIMMDFIEKVERGRKEHGVDLGNMPADQLFDEIQAEHIDALCYLTELKRRLTGQAGHVVIGRGLLVQLHAAIEASAKFDIMNDDEKRELEQLLKQLSNILYGKVGTE